MGKIVGKRILLADDEDGVREALKLLLSIDQHTVTEATNGREALNLYRPGEFDIVITDYAMPEMQGDELAAVIRSKSPTQPIVMITAFADMLQCDRNTIDAMLSKPFEFRDLRRILARLLPCGAS